MDNWVFFVHFSFQLVHQLCHLQHEGITIIFEIREGKNSSRRQLERLLLKTLSSIRPMMFYQYTQSQMLQLLLSDVHINY